MNKKLRKGDSVVVLAGNDKGKTGKVLTKKADRVIVEGVNIRKKHMRRQQQNQPQQIVEMEMPVHISNIALADADGKRIKLRSKVNEDKTRDWVYQKKGKQTVYRPTKKAKG